MFDNSLFVPMFDHCTAYYVSNYLNKTGEINIVIIQTEKKPIGNIDRNGEKCTTC